MSCYRWVYPLCLCGDSHFSSIIKYKTSIALIGHIYIKPQVIQMIKKKQNYKCLPRADNNISLRSVIAHIYWPAWAEVLPLTPTSTG